MVLYYTSNVVEPSGFIYVGKDKYESNSHSRLSSPLWSLTFADNLLDEDLIKYGWDEDVWFHADKLSSAHIYLRMTPSQTWDDLPQELLTDLAQLTKANSIEGNKKDNVTIIYTPWSNLKKDGSMDVGQVTFHNPRLVKRILVSQRENAIVNRLNKTKVERKPDLKEEKEDRQKELRKKDQAAMQQRVSSAALAPAYGSLETAWGKRLEAGG